jgi:hypothetical protein
MKIYVCYKYLIRNLRIVSKYTHKGYKNGNDQIHGMFISSLQGI